MKESAVEEAQFSERVVMLPKRVYEEIRLDFYDNIRNGKALWHDLIRYKRQSIPSKAALMIIKHIGCSLEEFLNPDVDLLLTYIERKHNVAKEAQAAKYGMKAIA